MAGKPEDTSAHKSTLSHEGGGGSKVDKALKFGDYAMDIAEGNFLGVAHRLGEDVTVGAISSKPGQQAMEKGLKTGFDVAAKVVPVASAWGQRAGAFVGMATTGAATLYKVGSELSGGNLGKAGTELAAGIVETVGNVVPSGVVGSSGREAVRSLVERTIGANHPEWVPEKSSYRAWAEKGYEIASSAFDTSPPHASPNPPTTSFAKIADNKGAPTFDGAPKMAEQFAWNAPGVNVPFQPTAPAMAAVQPRQPQVVAGLAGPTPPRPATGWS